MTTQMCTSAPSHSTIHSAPINHHSEAPNQPEHSLGYIFSPFRSRPASSLSKLLILTVTFF